MTARRWSSETLWTRSSRSTLTLPVFRSILWFGIFSRRRARPWPGLPWYRAHRALPSDRVGPRATETRSLMAALSWLERSAICRDDFTGSEYHYGAQLISCRVHPSRSTPARTKEAYRHTDARNHRHHAPAAPEYFHRSGTSHGIVRSDRTLAVPKHPTALATRILALWPGGRIEPIEAI